MKTKLIIALVVFLFFAALSVQATVVLTGTLQVVYPDSGTVIIDQQMYILPNSVPVVRQSNAEERIGLSVEMQGARVAFDYRLAEGGTAQLLYLNILD